MSTTSLIPQESNHSTAGWDYLPPPNPKAVEQAMLIGDISQMTDEQRIAYYVAVCRSLRLNPLTKPFQALKTDDGKMTLYPDKGCAEQLRKLHRVSLKVLGREILDGLYIITVQARTPDGREEESQGIVPLVKAQGYWEDYEYRGQTRRRFKAALDNNGAEIMVSLSAAERATAMMRAETKAKRRVTLAICGLGMPDWEAEPESPAHPMALTLAEPASQVPVVADTPSRAEADKTLADHIADLYGDPEQPASASATGLRQRIDDLLRQHGVGDEGIAEYWEKMAQKYHDLGDPTVLNVLYEQLLTRAEKKRAEAETATAKPPTDDPGQPQGPLQNVTESEPNLWPNEDLGN